MLESCAFRLLYLAPWDWAALVCVPAKHWGLSTLFWLSCGEGVGDESDSDELDSVEVLF